MLFAIFTHIDADQGIFVVKHELSQSLSQFSLTDARASEEDEGANWPTGIAEPGPAPANGV